jgi:hypothetical protein
MSITTPNQHKLKHVKPGDILFFDDVLSLVIACSCGNTNVLLLHVENYSIEEYLDEFKTFNLFFMRNCNSQLQRQQFGIAGFDSMDNIVEVVCAE